VPAPLADSYYEKLDLEIGGRLPLTEYLKNSLLGILVFDGRTLRALKPADHVFHLLSFFRTSAAGTAQFDEPSPLTAPKRSTVSVNTRMNCGGPSLVTETPYYAPAWLQARRRMAGSGRKPPGADLLNQARAP
jgi:hypothetical protein